MKVNNRNWRLWVLLVFWASAFSASASTILFEGKDVRLTLEFSQPEAAKYQDEVIQLADHAFSQHKKLFGGLPRDLQGKPYRDVKVSINLAEQIGGDADPGEVSLTIADNGLFGYASWQTVLIHELFHLWNAESFRYADNREQWFNEGVTDFYTYQTAARLGLLTPQQALQIAALPVGYYSSFENTGKLSMREATINKHSKIDNYFLVYNGGWVTGMLLDRDIRQRSQGQYSLDNLMRWLYRNYPRHERSYSMEDIVLGLQQSCQLDFADFFKRYIDGKQLLPLEQLPLGKAAWALAFNPSSENPYPWLYQTLGIVWPHANE